MPGWEKGWDSFLFDSVGTLGSGAGLAGAGIGVFGDPDDPEQAKAASSMGLIGGLSKMFTSVGSMRKAVKKKSVLGGFTSGFGMASGAADAVTNSMALAGVDKKKVGIAKGVSGALGTVGGGLGIANAIANRKKKPAGETAANIIGSAGGILGGVGKMLSGFGGSNSKAGKVGKWMGLAGAGLGFLGSAGGLLGRIFGKKKKPDGSGGSGSGGAGAANDDWVDLQNGNE